MSRPMGKHALLEPHAPVTLSSVTTDPESSRGPSDERTPPTWWPFVQGQPVPWRILRAVAIADVGLLVAALAGSLMHNDWSHFADAQATWSIAGAAGFMVLGGSYAVRHRFAAFGAGFLAMFASFLLVAQIPDGMYPLLVGCLRIGIGSAMIAAFVGVTHVARAALRRPSENRSPCAVDPPRSGAGLPDLGKVEHPTV